MTDTRVPSERAMVSSSTWVAAAAGTEDAGFADVNEAISVADDAARAVAAKSQ